MNDVSIVLTRAEAWPELPVRSSVWTPLPDLGLGSRFIHATGSSPAVPSYTLHSKLLL